MKLISLNCLSGRVFQPLMAFLKEQGKNTDVFCFQEMCSSKDPNADFRDYCQLNLLQKIQEALPKFAAHFAPMQDDFDITPDYPGQSQFGTAILYRKTLPVLEEGDFFIYRDYNMYQKGDWSTVGHNAVYLKTRLNDRPLTICSVHGTAQPHSKLDSPARLEESRCILEFLERHDGAKIVMGDFNLLPNTKSITMFEEAGFRNLIKEYNIQTTRGSHMRELFPEYEHGPYGFQEFADYAFVTPDVKVKSFEVPDVPISDHLPLILEIEL